MKLVMLAPPGGGKGTQSVQLSRSTGIAHLSSGDQLRAEVERDTVLGRRLAGFTARGDLVPDDLILEILIPVIVSAARTTGGYILDGFPRTVPQAVRAAELGAELGIQCQAAVYLDVPDEALVERLLARARQEGRADDTPDVIRHRLEVYHTYTEPLIDHYRGQGMLIEIEADRPPDLIQAEIRSRLDAAGVPEPQLP